MSCEGAVNVTQMHFARKGEVTPEMEFVADPGERRGRVRAERDRARPRDHPRQHQPPESEPMAIGRTSS
jgi:phosphomethylpyrimidine synthase